MGSNGSFYQNGLPLSNTETGLGNVAPGLPAPKAAESSFYLSGSAYVQSNPVLAAASASAAAASAAAAAASVASLAFANPTSLIGLAAVNGSATTLMRSDAAPALDQSIAPTWTSQHKFSPAGTLTALRVTVNEAQRGLASTHTLSSAVAAGALSLNLINIISDNAPLGNGVFGVGFNAQSTAGGSSLTGSRTAGQFSQALTVASNTDSDFVGSYSIGSASASAGGTNTGANAKSQVFGFAAYGALASGATNFRLVSGGEINYAIQLGATAGSKTGLQIIEHTSDAVDATGVNAGLAFSSQVPAIQLADGILFSTFAGQGLLKSTGTVLRADVAQSIANGIDLTNFTCSGAAYKSTGFSVDGSGIVKPVVLTVGTLPAAAGRQGSRSMVTDANATTFNSIVAAGGANIVPVVCDGTNWRIG